MPYGASRCPSCGLSLEGPLAARLFAALSTADSLLNAMRQEAPAAQAATTPTLRPAAPGAVATLDGPTTEAPARTWPAQVPPPVPPQRPHGGLAGASVPKILLGLGALCLLVAALVFLAVAWSAMGVAGRTATLLGFTAVAGGLSAWAAHRELRAAAESLSVVALGLLVFDGIGAERAGWLGDLEPAAFLVLLGVLGAGAGAAASLAVRRTPVGALVGAEVFAALGVACTGVGLVTTDWFAWSASLVLVTVLAGLVVLGAWTTRLGVLAVGGGLVATSTWVILAISSWDRALQHPSLRELWGNLEVWPLLATAALAATPAAVRRLPLGVRLTSLALAVVVVAGVVLAPFADEALTEGTLAGAVLLSAAAAASWFVPHPWHRSLGGPVGLGLVWAALAAYLIAQEGLTRVFDAGAALWTGSAGDSFAARPTPEWEMAAWLLPVLVASSGAALIAVARAFDWADRLVAPLLDLQVVVAVAVASAALTLALYPVPMWLLSVVLLITGAGFAAVALRRGSALSLALGAAFLALATVLGLHAEWLTLATLAVVLATAVTVHLRWPQLDVSVAVGAIVSVALAGLVWTMGAVADGSGEWTALVVVLVLASLVLALPYLDEPIRASGPATYARLGPEAGSLVSTGVVAAAGVAAAATTEEPTWLAVYLTLAGATASAMALMRRDRRLVGWLGGALLAAASWVRLADLGVETPEAYTLPSAVALLVVGIVHLRRNPDASTFMALTPGLTLALLPSLLWVLADPIEPRSALLGLACLGLVLGGVHLRWSAPVVYGAVVGTLLVLRLATPVAEAVPRWALIGTAGALLVVMGITWERRVHEARALAGYVRGLR